MVWVRVRLLSANVDNKEAKEVTCKLRVLENKVKGEKQYSDVGQATKDGGLVYNQEFVFNVPHLNRAVLSCTFQKKGLIENIVYGQLQIPLSEDLLPFDPSRGKLEILVDTNDEPSGEVQVPNYFLFNFLVRN
eukprot:Lithocolla_globosa_v1_NODE_2411_length_2018_cov_7.299542.p3 type:complete len:133 gc:universal NODE_2411_length_2018_cov_7.299542:45-443(+)